MTRRLLPALLAIGLVATACSSSGDESMFAPATTQAPAATTTTPAPTLAECEDDGSQLRSYAPTGLPVSTIPAGSYMQVIRDRDRLIVGVSGDTLLFGARNPITGQIEGFDIEVLHEIVRAIFGVETDAEVAQHIEYRVINYGQRIPSLQDGSVDIVAHTMTINCARWQQIAFSSQYFQSNQKVLVRLDNPADAVEELGGKFICVAEGSTNIDNINRFETTPKIEVVPVVDLTDCLVKFQNGEVDGITGDDTVLAGFVAQDPYAHVINQEISSEPYGLGINQDHRDFVQYVNAVLERMRADGTWTSLYQEWVAAALPGSSTLPPEAVYERQP